MLTLKAIAQKIGAEYKGNDVDLQGVSIDTRTIKPGDLFVALKAVRDGHDFTAEAIKKGASCLLVDHQLDLNVAQIIVKDTLTGLGDLARVWRQQFHIPVIALTGTAGKTTTKEMIFSILNPIGPTLATKANLNNAIGVPLTLLSLRQEHQYAVIEIGTNSPGEIGYAVSIAHPTEALITNIHAQHTEKLGSVEGVSQEKSDIFTALTQEGIAIINHDEPFAKSWEAKIATDHRITFGLSKDADVRAEHIHYDFQGCEFDLISPLGVQSIAIPVGGQHIIMNALAAAAATLGLGATLEQITYGLSKLKSVEGRFKLYHLPTGAMIIDDAYNASFKSVENAIDALKTFNGKKIFVMTNMGEMGQNAEHYHQKMGENLKAAGFEAVFLYGNKELLTPTLNACPNAHYFKEKTEIIDALLPYAHQNDTLILVKGAHAHRMDDIVTHIREYLKA